MKMKIILSMTFLVLAIACAGTKEKRSMTRTFGDDIDFLKKFADPVVLKSDNGTGEIIIVPKYQGRIMTSTLAGEGVEGFGWINYDKIASGIPDEHFNAYGGEDRLWLGPEGGQFSLYHKQGGPFTLENWYVPKQLDTEPFQVVNKTDSSLTLETAFNISNYSGTEFSVKIERSVTVFSSNDISRILSMGNPSQYEMVGFESENHLINSGDSTWNKSNGLLSLWILGMYNPGDHVVIALPYNLEGGGSSGNVVNDTYFGKVPPERLKITNGIVYFKGDGQYRSKIGMNWVRAKDVLGSYDPDRNVLTLIKYNKPEEEATYIKSLWEIMNDPYHGDVVNSYNDGPPEPGEPPMGPFYELETSSPVKELKPGEEIVHIHQTFHIRGTENNLNKITENLLGVKLQDIKYAF